MNSATRELSEWFLNDELSVSNVSQVSGSLVSSKLFSVCRMILLCQRMIRLASLQLYRPSDPVSRPNNFVLLRYSIIKYSPPKIVFNLKFIKDKLVISEECAVMLAHFLLLLNPKLKMIKTAQNS